MGLKTAIRRMNQPKMMGAIRHFMNTVGAALAMHGVVDNNVWQLWAGVALAFIALMGSILAPEKRKGPE